MEGRLLLQAGSWTSAANLPQPLFNVDATTAPDGQVYVIGDGRNGPNGLYVYTPVTNSWSETAPFPPGLLYSVQMKIVAGADGKIYAMGGTLSGPNDYSTAVRPLRSRGQLVDDARPPMPTPLVAFGLAGEAMASCTRLPAPQTV